MEPFSCRLVYFAWRITNEVYEAASEWLYGPRLVEPSQVAPAYLARPPTNTFRLGPQLAPPSALQATSRCPVGLRMWIRTVPGACPVVPLGSTATYTRAVLSSSCTYSIFYMENPYRARNWWRRTTDGPRIDAARRPGTRFPPRSSCSAPSSRPNRPSTWRGRNATARPGRGGRSRRAAGLCREGGGLIPHGQQFLSL